MWNFFVSENFMNNPFIGWHIESNFSLSIPTNQTWKNKKQYQNISDSEICIYICSKNKYMSELELSPEAREAFAKELSQIVNDFNSESKLDEIEEKIDTLQAKVDGLPNFVAQANQEFEKLTQLTSKDATFLILASALQILRQELINKFKTRFDNQEAADNTKGHNKEHSNRTEKYYASIEEMTSNPVPFDCIQKEKGVASDLNLKLSGYNHRYKALGHDPLLGLVFGTFNIMTNTITVAEGGFMLRSFHVHTGTGTNGAAEFPVDKISEQASTVEIFRNAMNRILYEEDGRKALGVALAKEIIHLMSDVRTKQSLPLPIVSWISPKTSQLMNMAGIDMHFVNCATMEAAFAHIINMIIKLLHGFCYQEKDGNRSLYDVRGKKVVMISNEIATVSNSLRTVVLGCLGDETAWRNFDVGGSIITIKQVMETPLEIARIKGEYVISKTEEYLKI